MPLFLDTVNANRYANYNHSSRLIWIPLQFFQSQLCCYFFGLPVCWTNCPTWNILLHEHFRTQSSTTTCQTLSKSTWSNLDDYRPRITNSHSIDIRERNKTILCTEIHFALKIMNTLMAAIFMMLFYPLFFFLFFHFRCKSNLSIIMIYHLHHQLANNNNNKQYN